MNGLFAAAGGHGDATVNYTRGTIDITQTDTGIAAGIFAASGDVGSATINTARGTTVMVSGQGSPLFGIDAFASGGNAMANVASTILINGSPTTTSTSYKRNPTGIIATTDPNLTTDPIGSASVTYSGPGITVHGGGGLGIVAVAGSPGATAPSGSVTVNASGPIVADGSSAIGILADSGTVRNIVDGNGPTTTTGPVRVTASNVSTPGQFGTAVSAIGGSGGVTVNIPSGGSIMGGWQATPFTIPVVTPFTTPGSLLLPGIPPASVTPPGNISAISGLPAAGIFLSANGAGAATLNNDGSIGALSDLAILGDPNVTNNGAITGFVQFTGGGNNIVNNGTFNLRNFADTNGDGVRDTVRVAVADLGTGSGNTFTNNGTLALAALPGTPPPKIDITGEYLPLGNPNNTTAFGGNLQGQLIGVATFTNSGVIDLQGPAGNPVPGDVLMITGGRGGSIPRSGGGTFVSNGGSLLLDTVLNQGGAATLSDTLVVDGTSVGPNGATKTFIHDAGDGKQAALTVGDGILVVQVLDSTRSALGAFTLAPRKCH
jgi:hypothetical protein